jgi:hypothetical protein
LARKEAGKLPFFGRFGARNGSRELRRGAGRFPLLKKRQKTPKNTNNREKSHRMTGKKSQNQPRNRRKTIEKHEKDWKSIEENKNRQRENHF